MDEDHINRVNWSNWKAWDDLYQKWVELYGKEEVRLDVESLKVVYEWFVREAGDRDGDFSYIDFLLEPSMTIEDAKKALKRVLEKSLTVEEAREILLERIRQLKEGLEELKKRGSESREPKGEDKEPNWVTLSVFHHLIYCSPDAL
jgi:transposase-like protein